MRNHVTRALSTLALITLAASGSRAETRWSGTAHGAIVLVGDGANWGGWLGLNRNVWPSWELGAEAGYVVLPSGFGSPGLSTLRSAGAVLRGRSVDPAPFHVLAGLGYYDLETRSSSNILGFPPGRGVSADQVVHEGFPGFALAVGFSGSGLMRPGFQLRWDEVLRPPGESIEVVSLAVGLYFN
jgi:hypothetical protein